MPSNPAPLERISQTPPEPTPQDAVDKGKAMAIFSHSSVVLGLPVFLIPMITRDNRFALHHGKAAAVNFGFLMVAIALTTVSCGILFPLILLCYIPALVGIVQAANGQLAGPLGWGNAGEAIFKNLHIKEEPRQLR